MEDTLREVFLVTLSVYSSLNPCFNGRYSQSMKELNNLPTTNVLILVLMEDTLRGERGYVKVIDLPS